MVTGLDLAEPGPEPGHKAPFSQRTAAVFGHLLVAGMILSIAVVLVYFLSRLFPDWRNGYVIPVAFLVAAEAMLTRRFLLRRVSLLDLEWYLVRGAEWVVLLVSLRLLIYALRGLELLGMDMTRFGFNVSGYFLQPEFLGVAFLMLLIWALANAFTQDLLDQEGDQWIDNRETLRLALQDREIARRRMVSRVFVLGAGLVILHALTVGEMPTLLAGRPPVDGGAVFVLLFFVLGLLLFSFSHFATLRALWRWEELPVSGEVALRWGGYGLIFLLLLMLLTAVLPTRDTLGLLDTARLVVGWLVGLLFWLAQTLWALMILGIGLLGRLLAGESPPPAQASPPIAPPPSLAPSADPVADPLTSPLATTLAVLRAMIFWTAFLTVVYYAFTLLIGRYRDLFQGLETIPWINALSSLWQRIRSALGTAREEARGSLRKGLQRLQRARTILPEVQQLPFFHPRQLSPRQRVRFYYLALVRRGEERGLVRKPAQTPREYAGELESALADTDVDLRELTEVFIESRYSAHQILPERAERMRTLWLKVVSALKRYKKT